MLRNLFLLLVLLVLSLVVPAPWLQRIRSVTEEEATAFMNNLLKEPRKAASLVS